MKTMVLPGKSGIPNEQVMYEVDNSSQVESMGYDPVSKRLFVEFKSGGVYGYDNVPLALWDELWASESKGQFLAQRVKGSDQFPYVKLADAKKKQSA